MTTPAGAAQEPVFDREPPKWAHLLAKSMIRAESLLEHPDARISGAMAQSLLAIAARTGVWQPGSAQETGPQGPQITLTLDQTRRVARGEPAALAELGQLVKLQERAPRLVPPAAE